jgi:endonuclease/exonuclease/phosphatase family metal-dependent hydrolase
MLSKLTFLFSLLLLGTRAGQQQPQPPSYNLTQRVGRGNFEATEKTRLHLNSYIPSTFGGIRFLTYNIHYHKDLHDVHNNVFNVLKEIQELNPTVAVFQEVLTNTSKALGVAFERGLDELGYKHRHFRAVNRAPLGNMIASKVPFTSTGGIDLSSCRSLTEVTIQLASGAPLTIYGTHLEVAAPKDRLQETQRVLAHIKSQSPANFILAADFNAKYDSQEMDVLTKSGLMSDSFRVLGWAPPNYSCWAGHAIDFALLSNAIQKDCKASFVYHSISSDHLPIVVDLNLPVNGDIARVSSNLTAAKAILNAASVTTVSLAIATASAVIYLLA